ncbi:UDP-N-acetylmuramoyl-L-alanyl-D-glutamate--2,6-diaminopimelate ligase [Coxiella endosymbiont of Amblyomma sculptum]|uniref:UDP-N-acetylmuramoyl-L-alanyl-D-glutamate--2, 6-diaminopimelate ligase n=1 Tax=Coxiella endosymbiont of Amblyomma sculptum TaxID=2487929 RepID=UPI00132E7694|nr:UDP-N-acetylmuramoyl-L-alanyl-D-glutamate--2,6-diaminopimelate ligase [Coxiella endosymbiont of Amblyomma sculptum]QHG92409.1 UDP-N-acetylmuramoyl-L-alanyl-D-glutamate--2,6-diaminopimelate ligase [Coxiella endosymbiont of Amblyomma sculptum]
MSGISLNLLLRGFSDKPLLPDVLIREIQIDSRQIQKGDLFIAYPGIYTDGRSYIKEALDKQASAVFYDAHDYKPPIEGSSVPLIPILGLRSRIFEISDRFYGNPTKSMKIIGITGTNGKTSCTHFVAQLLRSQNIPCGILGTLGYGFVNDLIKTGCTTPNSLQLQKIFSYLRRRGARVVVMEVSSHALDQHRVGNVNFNIAVLTQFSRDHLDYHGSIENYARAKESLFQQIGLNYGVINYDDEFGRYLIEKYYKKITIIGFSMREDTKDSRISLVVATDIKISTQGGFSVNVQTPWGNGVFTSSLYGRFNIVNALVVLGILGLFGIPLKEILLELSKLKNISGRMQVVECVKCIEGPKIVVDYAHTPDALRSVLVSLREYCCGGRLICVFGCGGDRDRGKRSKMGSIAERYADQIIITNDNPRSELPLNIIQDIQSGLKSPKEAIVEIERAAAIRYAIQKAAVNDIVLIAGKGHETTQIVNGKIFPFNDIQEIRKILIHETLTNCPHS